MKFFSPIGCPLFFGGNNLCKKFLSQTQNLDSTKHLLDFFPKAHFARLFSADFAVQEFVCLEIARPPPPTHKKMVWL